MERERTAAEIIASAVSNLSYSQLHPEVIHAAKRALLDTLGAILVGVSTPEVEAVCRSISDWGGKGEYPLFGTAARFSASDAALVNGTAAHAREVDDFGGCGHSGAVVIPAVLASAQRHQVTGKDVLLSIVAGYEVAMRVTDALGGYSVHNANGWHSTGTAGAFGAAAGAARAAGLDGIKTASALGLAGSYTGGVWAFISDGAMSKRLHAGKAAQTGLVAATLAAFGFSGPRAIFEDTWGSFLNTYAREEANRIALIENLDREWKGILRSGFKPYACCRGIHSSIDAAFELKGRYKIEPADVEQILVHGSEQTSRQLGKVKVESILDAQFSIPYSLALVFLVGRAGLDEYEGAYLGSSEISDFAKRVQVIGDKSRPISRQPTVEILLRNGRRLTRSVAVAKGDSCNPMSDDELLRKFEALASRQFKPERIALVADLVWHLDDLDDISTLVDSLVTSPDY